MLSWVKAPFEPADFCLGFLEESLFPPASQALIKRCRQETAAPPSSVPALVDFLNVWECNGSCNSKPTFAWGRSSDHLQRKGYSPRKSQSATKWFLAHLLFFTFWVLFPFRPLRRASLHLLLNVCAHTTSTGEVTPSQIILSSNTFSEMVPVALLEDQRQRLSGSTSAPPPKHTGIPNVLVSFKLKWVLLLILCSGLPISCSALAQQMCLRSSYFRVIWEAALGRHMWKKNQRKTHVE